MPRITAERLANLLRDLQPHLGQTQFPHTLFQALRRYFDRRVAVATDTLSFPEELPEREPTLIEAGVSVWFSDDLPDAVVEAVRTIIRIHATVGDLRSELLTIENRSSRSTRMIGILAHEIKNPLFAILGSLELLKGEPLGENAQKLIEAAYASAERMHKLVSDSLKLLSIEEEGVRLKAERCSINEILEDVVREARPVAEASRVQLRVVAAPGDAYLLADKRWLQQAVLNIVLNAIKYTPEGGRVLVRAYKTADSVGFLVEDTGPGIPPEQLERIFEPFQRGGSGKEGSGLGLTIVKRVVEAHGGEVSVKSQPGQGSTFSIRLPRLVADRATANWALRMLILTAIVGLIVTRLPIYPVKTEVRTLSGVVPVTGQTFLQDGGAIELGGAEFVFDPGSRFEFAAKRSYWGGDLRVALRMHDGGVSVQREGHNPKIEMALNYANLMPLGTKFYAKTGQLDLISLYEGRLRLQAPGFKGDLAPGEGAVVDSAGVQKRELLAAPAVRASAKDGELVLRWPPVDGAREYVIEMLLGGAVVGKWRTDRASWNYTPEVDREVEIRVYAVDEFGLMGESSNPIKFLEEGSFCRGHRLYQSGNYEEAARSLQRAVEFNPANAKAWLELGISQLRLGKVVEGKRAINRALQLEPDYEKEVALLLAEALEKAGDLEEAVKYYGKARDVSARDAVLGEIRAYLGLGNAAAAEELACDWLSAHPKDAAAARLLRQALDRQKKRYSKPGCPLFQKPKRSSSGPKPQQRPQPEPKQPVRPTPPAEERVCNPFCN